MLSVAIEGSDIDEVMKNCGDYYEKELEFKAKKLTSVFEPLVILIMAFIVGFVVLAIAMPMFDMVNI